MQLLCTDRFTASASNGGFAEVHGNSSNRSAAKHRFQYVCREMDLARRERIHISEMFPRGAPP